MILALLLSAFAETPSVQTRDLTPCTGKTLAPGTQVTLHWTGTVQGADAPFLSTREGRPTMVQIGVGGILPGMEQGLHGMSVGCRREIVVPPELAYGAEGRPPVIPANSTVVLDVELIDVEAGRAPPAAPTPVSSYETLPSGLQVHDLEMGTGPQPNPGQYATVEYTLWLPNGTRIDSSLARTGPFTYQVDRGKVIKGWEEAVRGMKVGGTRQFRVPWQLGYGAGGSPPKIPGKTDLVFEVTLIGVK